MFTSICLRGGGAGGEGGSPSPPLSQKYLLVGQLLLKSRAIFLFKILLIFLIFSFHSSLGILITQTKALETALKRLSRGSISPDLLPEVRVGQIHVGFPPKFPSLYAYDTEHSCVVQCNKMCN